MGRADFGFCTPCHSQSLPRKPFGTFAPHVETGGLGLPTNPVPANQSAASILRLRLNKIQNGNSGNPQGNDAVSFEQWKVSAESEILQDLFFTIVSELLKSPRSQP
jgi:hypothetical protein